MSYRRAGIVIALLLVLALAVPSLAQQPVVLELWNVFNPAVSKDGIAHREKYALYEQLHPGIKINHNVMTYADLRQKAIVAGQGKTGPDVLHMLGEWVNEFVRLGLVADITDRVNAWRDKDKFPDVTWSVASVNGRIYGIPSIASTRVLVYRGDLFDEVGVGQPPRTWDELRTVAKKLTLDRNGDGQPEIYGMAFATSTDAIRGPQEFLVLLWSTGAEFVTKVGDKYVPGFTVEQAASVFRLYYDMMHVDKTVPLFSRGWEYEELDSAFEAGTLAMTQNGSWMRNRAERAETGKFWRTAPFPYSKVPATYLEVKVEGIGAFSKHKDEAWEFLQWLYSRDNMADITKYDNLPSRSDVMALPFYQADPVWRKTFLEVIPTGKVVPPIPTAPLFRAMMEEVQAVLYLRKTPEQAARSFYDRTQQYLATVRD